MEYEGVFKSEGGELLRVHSKERFAERQGLAKPAEIDEVSYLSLLYS